MGYANEIECVSGWTPMIDITQPVKCELSSIQFRVMTYECQNKCLITFYCKQNQTNNELKHVKL